MIPGRKKLTLLWGALFSTSLVLFACTSSDKVIPQNDTTLEGRWLNDGSILLSRVAPAPPPLSPSPVLGFIPTQSSFDSKSPTLVIDRSAGTISLPGMTKAIPIKIGNDLVPGTRRVVLKQESPLWYAPDAYFTPRQMTSPPSGDKARFLRGALGEHAIFLDGNVVLHSAVLWSDDVGGVQLNSKFLEAIYSGVKSGDIIEIR